MRTIILNKEWQEVASNSVKLQCIKGLVCIYVGENKPNKNESGFLLSKREFFTYEKYGKEKLYCKARDFNNTGKIVIYDYKKKRGFLW